MLVPDHIRYAAEEANLAVVEAYLDEAGPGAVNRQDEYGETILVSSLNSSIEEGHVQFARMLIARGADVNIASENDSDALHMACYPGGCAPATPVPTTIATSTTATRMTCRLHWIHICKLYLDPHDTIAPPDVPHRSPLTTAGNIDIR